MLHDLQQDEGLALGGSAGINVAGAMRVARALGPGHTVVTVLCDLAARYAGKLYSPLFLQSRGLPPPPWLAAGGAGGGGGGGGGSAYGSAPLVSDEVLASVMQ